jgi:hydrogenase nickel incorporation protein HypB
MGRFHRHPDGTIRAHEHADDAHEHGERDHGHEHGHDVGDHSGYVTTGPDRIAVLEDILSENDHVAAEK